MTIQKQFQPLVATFTVSSMSATVGAVYTTADHCAFTVLATIVAQLTLVCAASGTPAATGTLTKVSGTGDATIAYSAVSTALAYGTDPLNPSGFEGQGNYDEYANVGIVGMPYDMAEAKDQVSFTAAESIGLGLAVVQMGSYNKPGERVCRLPRANHAQIVITSATTPTTSETINLKVNGTSMGVVTVGATQTWAAVAALLVTALEAMADVDSAEINAEDDSDKTIDVYSVDGKDCLVTTLVYSTANATLAATMDTTDTADGISMQTQGKEQDLGTLVLNYKAGDQVNCMAFGRIWVLAECAVDPKDSVYMRLQDGTTTIGGVSYAVVRGGLRNDSDGDTCVLIPGWSFWQGCQDVNNGLAVVQTK